MKKTFIQIFERARKGSGNMKNMWIGYILVSGESGSHEITCGRFREIRSDALRDANAKRADFLRETILDED